jgi:hypothetical protein
VALVRTDVSEEPGASFIRVTKIGELGTTQAATSNRRMLRSQVPPKRRFLQEPHGVITQKTPFFMVTAVKTSNLPSHLLPNTVTDSMGIPDNQKLKGIWNEGYDAVLVLPGLSPNVKLPPQTLPSVSWIFIYERSSTTPLLTSSGSPAPRRILIFLWCSILHKNSACLCINVSRPSPALCMDCQFSLSYQLQFIKLHTMKTYGKWSAAPLFDLDTRLT